MKAYRTGSLSCALVVSVCFGASAAACGGASQDTQAGPPGGAGAPGGPGGAAGGSAHAGGAGAAGSGASAGHGGASGGAHGGSGGAAAKAGASGASGSAPAAGSGGGAGAGGAGAGGAGAGHAGAAGASGGAGAPAGASGKAGAGGTQAPQTLMLMPPSATITVTSSGAPATQQFAASLSTSPGTPVPVKWTLDTYALGDIDPSGLFKTSGVAGGTVLVKASYGALSASAPLIISVNITETIPSPSNTPVDPANLAALGGPSLADPGPTPTTFLYPYDKTVMPRGLTSPLLQFSPGSVPPEDAKITLSANQFSWQGVFHVDTPQTPRLTPPQAIWDGAMLSGGTVTISVDKAAGGKAYGTVKSTVVPAAASLKGAVYYMTYQAPQTGLWSVRPGVTQPATQLISGCVVCHSVSANGTHLSVGSDDAAVLDKTGVYTVGSDGSATQLTPSPPGLGGDSRQLSFGVFTPDGRYITRSQDNFWGGLNTLAFRVDDAGKALVPATVTGLGAAVSSYVPAFSPDGKRYGFTNGDGEPSAFGTPHRSLSVMDVAIDTATDTLAFSNRNLVLDNGPGGSVAKFVSFLPNSDLMVLEEGENFNSGFGEMLPTWGPDSSFDTSTGRLSYLDILTKQKVVMANLNQGNAPGDADRNYEPFALPVTAGGYFWIVFTSIREYGNVYQGAAARKQLWVAAIDTNAPPGSDPSHPPFFLPNQSDSKNERGFWALEPCKGAGTTCSSGDECCGGFCRPQDAANPASPLVCQMPLSGQCSHDSEKCATNADCCDVAQGTQCIGGFCTSKP